MEGVAASASIPNPVGNFPTSITNLMSITSLTHNAMANSSDTSICRHRLTFHPIAFRIFIKISRCWYFHQLQ
jgi:hypothetical protein